MFHVKQFYIAAAFCCPHCGNTISGYRVYSANNQHAHRRGRSRTARQYTIGFSDSPGPTNMHTVGAVHERPGSTRSVFRIRLGAFAGRGLYRRAIRDSPLQSYREACCVKPIPIMLFVSRETCIARSEARKITITQKYSLTQSRKHFAHPTSASTSAISRPQCRARFSA